MKNKLVLILTSKWLVAMRIIFELYWVHLIYGMVWFLAMVNMDFGWRIWQAICRKFQWLELMAWLMVLVIVGCRVLRN
jgi:hypothetical protein